MKGSSFMVKKDIWCRVKPQIRNRAEGKLGAGNPQ
jgi:hypothetical protein